MTFKTSLDRYLTREPDNYKYDSYVEQVCEEFDNEFYSTNVDWILDFDGQCNSWLITLFDKDKSPVVAAKTIERAKKIYRVI